MKLVSLAALALLLLPAALPAAIATRAELRLQAGSAKVDITPPASALRPGDAIRDPLFVRAIFVGNGETCAVLIGIDRAHLEEGLVADAAARIAKATGCAAANIVISATHSHSASTIISTEGLPTDAQVATATVRAAREAAARPRPARIGFGTTQLSFNVNRDQFDRDGWYQGSNRQGPSDKALAVIELLDDESRPIGIYFNYPMHAINFYLAGVVSADVPGAAAGYLERHFPGAVAVYTQGASGDQNPLLIRPMLQLSGLRTHMPDAGNNRIDAEDQWRLSARQANANTYQVEQLKTPLPPAEQAAYRVALAETGAVVDATGVIIGESVIDVMRNLIPATAGTGRIWAGQRGFTCPGRDRIDPSVRQNVLPAYRDGAPVNLRAGLLRIADISIASVNAELYSRIGTRLKAEAPASKVMLVTLANGRANSGYVYSNDAASHLTFQVIASRLKPGCAEDAIVGAEMGLFKDADAR